MRRIVLILVALLVAGNGHAAESYSAKTLSFDFVETEEGPVRVLWEGEIVNDSARDATLCAVLLVLNARGKVLEELESAAMNVKRFATVKRREVFLVDAEVWSRADTLEETARVSTADPINGERIHQVEIYTTSWCPYCKKAIDFFVLKGVPFTEYDVEEEPAAAREKERIAPGAGIPVAVIDGQVIQGFSASAYEKALSGSDE